MLRELLIRNRSYRRFQQNKLIDIDILKELVEHTRFCPSGRNLQPLKYILVNTPELCSKVFPNLAWAGYLKDWDGPSVGEQPSAYIVMLEDQRLTKSSQWDQGIAAQTIMLGAVEHNLGGCMIASVKKDNLSAVLKLQDYLEIVLVLAIGYPIEKVVVDDIDLSGDIKYWRDNEQVHHVPKRKLDDLIWAVNPD
jgi:nitroreductase